MPRARHEQDPGASEAKPDANRRRSERDRAATARGICTGRPLSGRHAACAVRHRRAVNTANATSWHRHAIRPQTRVIGVEERSDQTGKTGGGARAPSGPRAGAVAVGISSAGAAQPPAAVRNQ